MNRNVSLLNHILEDINDIQEYITGLSYVEFVNNTLIRKAACMSLINIGELTKALSTDFKNNNKQIAWKDITGLRDITAHKYHSLNLDIIWAVLVNDIPVLKEFIENELSSH
jgi:uncharacterized protein with HEPN domain